MVMMGTQTPGVFETGRASIAEEMWGACDKCGGQRKRFRRVASR